LSPGLDARAIPGKKRYTMSRTSRQAPVHLNALRAFEAAARHLSFAAAGEELHVTPSAISQQVRTLEDYLGIPLFHRTAGSIALTAEAIDAYPDIHEGLARLVAGLGKMRPAWRDAIVTLSVPTSFAAKWLLPRLERFRAAHPGLDLRLDTSDRLADYAVDGIDIGVRYGHGAYAGMTCELLLTEEVFPVCSPLLLVDGAVSMTLDQLARQTLIHDTTIDFDPSFPNWTTWFAAHGVRDVPAGRSLQFNSTVLATQAAIDGQGVALGRSVVVAADLLAGRLARPFDGAEPTRCAYHVLYPTDALERPKVRILRDWLFAEAAAAAE
jgi:LysR family transcriptional regulator, glycine cleavage system transcriptional activator